MDGEGRDVPGLVVFRLGGHRFGIELPRVVELLRMVAVTPVPDAPDALLGAVNLRGAHAPAIDLRVRLGLPTRPAAAADRIVVVESKDGKVCLVVDEVDDVVTDRPDRIEPLQNLRGKTHPVRRVARIGDSTVMILEVDDVARGYERLEMLESLDAGG